MGYKETLEEQNRMWVSAVFDHIFTFLKKKTQELLLL